MKKRLSLLLACVFLLTALLTACADPNAGGSGGGDDDYTGGGIFDSIPEYDFEGESIDFLANE
ncbi:MAG: hypothetical protein IJY04_09005, partial [Clostridia bacterium]|nr:hypothetical protein [Clostridia bacterium]